MPGYSPFLPLTSDPNDGLTLNKTYAAVAKQNFKMLLLTVPGERIMDSNFGVGLQKYFFENITAKIISKINSKIHEQVSIYLPYIHILRLDINSDVKRTNDLNAIIIHIEYEIKTVKIFDSIQIEFDMNPDVV